MDSDERIKVLSKKQNKKVKQEDEEEEDEGEADGEDDETINKMTTEEYNKFKLMKFGQRGILNKEQIKIRLHEIRQNFYNRLESKKLIKKQGRIPFTEHMSITNENRLQVSGAAAAL